MISKTRSIPPAWKLRSDPGFPQISLKEMSHARPALLMVFSITQSDHLLLLSRFHSITDFGKQINFLKVLSKGSSEIIIQAQTNKVESIK